MDIALQSVLQGVMLLGLRVSGLMIFAPFLGSASIPVRIKIVLTILITAVLYPTISAGLGSVHLTPMTVFSELLIGIVIGISSNMVFEAAAFAGQILSFQMGYSLVNIMDPTSQVETTVMSVFHQTVVMLIFLRLDVHHWILRAMAHSFDYLPIGSTTANGSLTATLLQGFASVFHLGIQIAAPVLLATFTADLALGMLGKASPRLPLMLMGPSIKSVLGLIVLAGALTYWPSMFERYFSESLGFTDRLLHLAH